MFPLSRRLFPKTEELIGNFKAYHFHDNIVPDELLYFIEIFLYAGNSGKIRSEEKLVAEFLHGMEIFEEILGGNPDTSI